jgi:hypothetical protein
MRENVAASTAEPRENITARWDSLNGMGSPESPHESAPERATQVVGGTRAGPKI